MRHSRHIILLALFALTSCALSTSCKTSRAEKKQERLTEDVDGPLTKELSSKEKLFLAIEQEFIARGWMIATRSERFSTIATDYEQISTRMRKRRVGSIIFLPKGAALKVIVEYQRDAGPEGQPAWEVLEAGKIKEKAASEELEIARAIEKRFHSMR